MIDRSIVTIKKQMLFTLALFMVLLAVLFVLLKHSEYMDELEVAYLNNDKLVKKSFEKEKDLLKRSYDTRIESISGMTPIIESFQKGDDKKLYESSFKIYERLRKENKYLKIMHYHSKDNITVLRMHNPKKRGDDLTKLRPMVTSANLFLKKYFGLEIGKHGLYFRVASPVFSKDKKEHIGVLEMGIELEYITKRLNSYFPTSRFAYLIDKKNTKIDSKSLEDVENSYIFDESGFFKKVFKDLDLNAKYSMVEFDNKTFIVTAKTSLKDYQDQKIGVLLNAIDVSDIKNGHKEQVLSILLFWLILFVFLIFIINYGLDQYIKRFELMRDELDNKFEELNKNKKLLERYTIYSETNLKGQITYVSDAFCEISGYTREELIGKSHNIVRHEDMPSEIYEELWSLLSAGQYWEGEIKNKRKDGGYYWVEAYITPKHNTKGDIIGYSAVRKDITLHKKLMEEE